MFTLLSLFTGCLQPCNPADLCTDADGDLYPAVVDCDDADPEVHPGAQEIAFDNVDNDCDESTLDEDPDGDGATSGDCAPYDAAIHPQAREIWYDGVDQDCLEDSDYDADRDGYDWDAYGGEDCDDTTKKVSPDAEEVCNAIDDDCDGTVDGASATDATTYWADDDQDQHGDANAPVQACSVPDGYVDTDDDCDDDDPGISPSAEEWPGDAVDEDCDGCATLAGGVGAIDLGAATLLFSGPVDELHAHGGYVALRSGSDGYRGDASGVSLLDEGITSISTFGEDGATSDAAVVQVLDGWLAEGFPEEGAGVVRTSEGYQLFGKVEGDAAGATRAAGDIDGDGAADLLIGAPLGGTSDKGRVYLASGPITADAALGDLKQQGGGDDGQGLGQWLASAQDANGDGYDDVLAGNADGTAELILGPMKTFSTSPQAVLQSGVGSLVGDVDCDNRSDIVVGGQLYLAPFEGVHDNPDATWQGTLSAPAGDVDGDRYDDVYVVSGQSLLLVHRGGL